MIPGFYKRPWIIIAVCAALTVFFGLQVPNLVIENDIREYLPHKDASYKRLVQSDEDFGGVYIIGVALESEGTEFLTKDNLTIVRNISLQCIDLDNVDKVDSLTNIDYVCTEDGSLVAQGLVEDDLFEADPATGREEFIGTSEDIKRINSKLHGWDDMYDRVIISDDQCATQLQVTLKGKIMNDEGEFVKLTGNQRMETLHQVRAIVEKEIEGSGLNYAIYGDPVISDDAKKFMISDLRNLVPLVVLVVILCLFFSFKTVDGTVLPLLCVLMSTIWCVGIMAIFGLQFTIVTSVIPVALIAVGSAYGIHVLTHYYVELDQVQGQTMTKELHQEIVWKALKGVFVAVLLAGLTTVVGFISLVSSPIEPLHTFAIVTSLGVVFSLVLGITFIPAMLLIKPLNKVGYKSKRIQAAIAKAKAKAEKRLEKLHRGDEKVSPYYKVYDFFAGTKARLIVFSVAIVVFSYLGVRNLVIDTAMVNYFSETSKLRQDIDYANKRFAGTNSVYMIVSLDKPESEEVETVEDTSAEESFDDFSDFSFDDFSFDSFGSDDAVAEEPAEKTLDMTNVELLKALDNLQNYLEGKYPDIGKIVSFTTFVKRMNQVMNDPDSYDPKAPSEKGFVNPNAAYSKALSSTLTTKELLTLFNQAYVEAGGKDATTKKMVEILEGKFNLYGIAFYEIPYDESKYPVASKEELNGLVSQYLMLLGGDTMARFAIPAGSFSPEKLRVQIQLRNHSTDLVGKIIDDSEAYVKAHFPEGYKVEFTGAGELEYVMTNMVVSSQLASLLISLLSVFIIITISFKSGWAGLLGAIPLAFTIILNYMVMGFLKINLDLVTSIIASVAIGVGIDYTIHFLETFHAERQLSSDVTEVLNNTFTKSGTGIVTNALAVGLGFLVLCLSQFVVLRYIGVLIAIVMFSSSALSMIIIPGFLNLFDPKFMKPKNER